MNMYEILSYDDAGYAKVFSYLSWRIAMLNHIDELNVDNLTYVECHHETDEVFILLEGACTMILATSNEVGEIAGFKAIPLEKNKIFVVKKGIYHTHTLSKDAKVLVVEEENTSYENSHRMYFNDTHKALLREQVSDL